MTRPAVALGAAIGVVVATQLTRLLTPAVGAERQQKILPPPGVQS